jgi:effector-binding domain-containing protein
MRWFAVVAAVLILLVGGLFGAGYFFLPARSSVTRSVAIERPAATLHAMLDNLRTFNEWSPWYAADPAAEYVIVGDAGVGQKATWRSKIAAVGVGSHRITRSQEPSRVESVIEFSQRGSANLTWTVTPNAGGNGHTVEWTMSSTCTDALIRVPCRLINQVTRASIESDLELGLERFKILADQLPAADFAALRPEFLRAAPLEFAFVENDVRREDAAGDDASAAAARDSAYAQRVATAISQSLVAVETALRDAGATAAGPPILVTLASNRNQISFRVGFPYTGPGPAADPRVATGQTPSGKAMKIEHIGPSQTMSSTYRLIDAYLRAHRLQAAGGPWEVYVDRSSDPAKARTEIYVPLY